MTNTAEIQAIIRRIETALTQVEQLRQRLDSLEQAQSITRR